MHQRVQAANQKLKENMQTQEAEGRQAMSVLCMTLLEAV